jgi:hypothetical protein
MGKAPLPSPVPIQLFPTSEELEILPLSHQRNLKAGVAEAIQIDNLLEKNRDEGHEESQSPLEVSDGKSFLDGISEVMIQPRRRSYGQGHTIQSPRSTYAFVLANRLKQSTQNFKPK